MRRLVEEKELVSIPKLLFESELTNNTDLQVKLERGCYLIELHQRNGTHTAFIKVVEDEMSLSSVVQFNPGEVGTKLGYYQYDEIGEIIEFYDGNENPIAINGHIDIYKF